MAGILDGLVKKLSSFAPQDDPDVKLYHAQNELKELTEKENSIYASLGKTLYAQGGKEAYPETAAGLEALATERTAAQQRLEQAQSEKAEKERAAAEAGRTCPACGTLNAEGTKFCQECGTKLPGDAKKFCASCGEEVKPGMRFCGTCGAKQE